MPARRAAVGRGRNSPILDAGAIVGDSTGGVRSPHARISKSVGASTAFSVVLPYPPTLNTLYRRVGNRTLISQAGRRYGELAALCVRAALDRAANTVPPTPHVVTLLATPPDRRRRDLDNLPKKILDVVYAGIGVDDSRIDRLVVEWRRDGGTARVEVLIEPAATSAPERGGGRG